MENAKARLDAYSASHQLPDANFFGWRLFFLPQLASFYEWQSS